ncbi:hypothetical protein H072_5261 [Dactylellina haptotyla CBS 200.50]|uniref:Uncharacterized protein n=1 Tax=Dactylellina haptotyla (strain CBS 200.50) TaxID=1284197 RepID=S8AD08_DACHA|nr:hypothetical protein H072_5261 [Dactylellina haptotyla CBS 200.50]
MSKQFGEIWIVIDALDECRTRITTSADGVLAWIADVLKGDQCNIHILVTSRPENDIQCGITDFASPDSILPIEGSIIADDIKAYIHKRVRTGGGLKRWRFHPEVREEIENELIKKSSGIWAACQLDALETCLDYPSLIEALISLPETLGETYHRILRNIPKNCQQKATRILQFLTWSPNPLSIEEMIDAIAVDIEGEEYFNPKHRMPDHEEIISYCSNLVVLVPSKGRPFAPDRDFVEVRLAHLSVQEYLISAAHKYSLINSFQYDVANRSNAMVCLAYLLQFDHDIKLEKSKIEDNYPFTTYCMINWPKFAKAVENTDIPLQEMILKFLHNSNEIYYQSKKFTYPSYTWVPPLYFAARRGLLKTAENLINLGADINNPITYSLYGSALGAASYGGHYKTVELLLGHGAEINAENEDMRWECKTALQTACEGGDINMVSLLLDRGARINTRDGRSSLALEAAMVGGRGEIVELLLDRDTNVGVDADNKGYRYGVALIKASAAGEYEIAKLLLDRGANINYQDSTHGTALQAAAKNRRSVGIHKTIQLLLDHGADINAQSRNLGTALHIALGVGNYDVAELLLDRGADVNAPRGKHVDGIDVAFAKGLERARWRRTPVPYNNHDKITVSASEIWMRSMSRDPELARLKLLALRIAKIQGYLAGSACPETESRQRWWWPIDTVAA